jgi:hypothetical protein
MKRTLICAALALVAAASCQKNAIPQGPEPAWDGPTGQIHLSIGSGSDTKVALSGMNEDRINQVQVFIFNSAGALETDRFALNSSSSSSIDMSITSRVGDKTVYALVNAPRITRSLTLSELEGTLSDLKDNSVNNLVMSGKKTVDVKQYDGASPTSLTIYVKKLAAAIVLSEVNVDFSNTVLEGSTFVLKEVYAKNVVGKAPLGVSTEGDGKIATGIPMALSDTQRSNVANWYNKLKLDTTPLALTYDACNLTSFAKPSRVLYVYPNATVKDSDSASGDFTPRHTRLVLHAQVAGKDSYYPFDLPVLEPNKKYSVSVSITMLGKPDDNDDTRVTVGLVTPVIKISNWDGTTNLPYNM